MLVSTESGLTTVKMLSFPWTPCADALIAVVPAASPVASPVAVMVAVPGLALAQVNTTSLIAFPYWSLPTALNCWVPPVKIDGCAGVTRMVAKAGGGASTVSAAGALVTPEADAVTCMTPGDTPVATPPWKIAIALSFAPSSDEVHVNAIPAMGWLYWSKP